MTRLTSLVFVLLATLLASASLMHAQESEPPVFVPEQPSFRIDRTQLVGPRFFARADLEASPPVLEQPLERRPRSQNAAYFAAYFYNDGRLASATEFDPSTACTIDYDFEYLPEGRVKPHIRVGCPAR